MRMLGMYYFWEFVRVSSHCLIRSKEHYFVFVFTMQMSLYSQFLQNFILQTIAKRNCELTLNSNWM